MFDLLYCCREYGLYKGLAAPEPPKSIKNKKPTPEDVQAIAQLKLREELAAVEEELAELERKCDEYSELSIVGTRVATAFGSGMIVEQNVGSWVNLVRVRLDNGAEKCFQIGKNVPSRPHFEENDEELAVLFTDYEKAMNKIGLLKKRQKTLADALL